MKKIKALIKRLLKKRWKFWIGNHRFEGTGLRLTFYGKSGEFGRRFGGKKR
jgi:hypothetical protein